MKHLALTLLVFTQIISFSQYFQQEVNTTIDVTLNDSLHELNAFEKIEYINNSRDTLSFIYFHLWPNAYKNNATALAEQLNQAGDLTFHFSPDQNRGHIDSLDFKINNQRLKLVYDDNIDYVKVYLNKPLPPNKSVTITTPFRVKIPYGNISRLGHLGQAYQLTQWFPKPAVYDENGWNVMPYLSQGEFYSEYGSYDVKITLPENYVVGATGDLVNGEKELEWLDKKVKKTQLLIESGGYKAYTDMSTPKSSKKLKTLHYHQDNVHDFAFFVDKRWHVLKGEVTLPHSKRKVTTWAMFTNSESHLWKDAIAYLDSSIYYYSLWTGDYPYNQVTAIDGALTAGAGMEYPNVTVIGTSYTPSALEQVIIHEVGHNWFYGILGSNERKHAWMDEGMNSYTENRTTETLHPNSGIGLVNKNVAKKIGLDQYQARGLHDLSYLYAARRNYDQPIESPASLFTPTNYGTIIYSKTAIGFDYLLAYLGDSLFNQCMHTYFDEWKFKHPQPKDVKAVFESVSKKDLSWFFQDYIQTTKKIDYKMSAYQKSSNTLTVKNNSDIAAPISIYGLDKNDSILFKQWSDGFYGKQNFSLPQTAYKLVLDYDKDIPEIDRTNDVIKTSGILKKSRPIKLKLLGEIENRDYYTINFLPLVGWNETDRGMLGLAFYNTTFPEKKLEWLAIPMYSFQNKAITGLGSIYYNWYPTPIFRKVSLGYEAKSFSYAEQISENNIAWYKHSVNLNAELYNKKLRTAPKQSFALSFHNIREKCYSDSTGVSSNYFDFSYQIQNKQTLKPASLKVDYTYGDNSNNEVVNTISLTGKMRINYNLKRDGISFRLFAGKSLYANTNSRYNWRMSGQTGLYDYMFNNTFLGRTSNYPNFLAQQLGNSHGGFKTFTNTGSSNNWILALNTKLDLPKLPIGIFADIGYYPYKENNQGIITNKIGSNFDVGLYIPIKKNFIELYMPLLFSENIQKEFDYNGITFWQRMTFVIHFNSMNPFKIIQSIKP
ncbi:MAG: M1 family metallopeptidase [Flavobacteriales bacterium]|jgi:hypothetical protein|nr:M1 family metallopeptidase [Flavobacteriales bacterium]